jgi:hypothetical protein
MFSLSFILAYSLLKSLPSDLHCPMFSQSPSAQTGRQITAAASKNCISITLKVSVLTLALSHVLFSFSKAYVYSSQCRKLL